MTTKIKANTFFIAAITSAAIALTAGTAVQAETKAEVETEFTHLDVLALPVKLSQASQVAEAAANGQIVEITLDEFEDQPVYFATLLAETSLSEVMIDAQDGKVIASTVHTVATPELFDFVLEEEFDEDVEFCDHDFDIEAFELMLQQTDS